MTHTNVGMKPRVVKDSDRGADPEKGATDPLPFTLSLFCSIPVLLAPASQRLAAMNPL